jgi:DNA topoisomerase-2
MNNIKMSKNKSVSKSASKSVEDKYKHLDPIDHILVRPDMYIGSVDTNDVSMWILQNNRFIKSNVTFSPGLYKIFDEILVNARDHSVRDKKCKTIKVNIDKDNNEISVWNDGTGIEVKMHKEFGTYVPEMIFGHLRTSSNYEDKGKIVGGKNGFGAKCISHDTQIPLWNGTLKLAKEINIGDKLIGDDGTVRNVLNVIHGRGKMYKVNQMNGESYKVNDNHILTLHMPDHKVIFWNQNKSAWTILWWNHKEKCINSKSIKVNDTKIKCPECNIELCDNLKRHYERVHKDKKINNIIRKKPIKQPEMTQEIIDAKNKIEEFAKTINDNNIFDINISDYNLLNDTTKSRLAGIRNECIKWDNKEIKLDPYMLGLWLGDGMQSGYEYTCYGDKDKEIIEYIENWCNNNDANLKKKSKYHYTFSSKSNYKKKGCAPLKKLLDSYNLTKEKHIPNDYKINDKNIRLQVLAGIIDTDGHVSRDGTRVTITQGLNHKRLVFDIIYLSRSLGFNTSISLKKTSWRHKNILKKGFCYNINITGNIEAIPTKLPRKKCNNQKNHSTKSTGYIHIDEIADDDYVGIQIDGNERFLINDFTVTHNCTNIFSTEFSIETVDSKEKKYYKQTFTDNMKTIGKAIIKDTSQTESSYTKITFKPDFNRFNLNGLTNDLVGLFNKRVYDICASCLYSSKKVKVYLNEELIEINTFADYVKLYYEEVPKSLTYIDCGERWKVCLAFDNESGFTQVSFVNGILTYNGGTHVSHVVNQVVDKLIDIINKKNKKIKIKPDLVKSNISVYIDCSIEDPTFNSQVKDKLTTKESMFGSKCEIPEDSLIKFSKSGIIDEIISIAEFKESKELQKTDGKKTRSLKEIEKLEDAEDAGGPNSHETLLILTEGDSAKTFAISGLEVIGSKKYGVFPLRGKLINIRQATIQQIQKNEEFINIKRILGLKQGVEYKSVKDLRYGGILILTDQDVDGYHIKGLIINMIHTMWPSLILNDNFIKCFKTPLMKTFLKSDKSHKNPKVFYNVSEYDKWCQEIGEDVSKWEKPKYYKGLGTSTPLEAKQAFMEFEKSLINYVCDGNESTDESEDSDDTNETNESNDSHDAQNQSSESDSDDDNSQSDKSEKSNKSIKSSKSIKSKDKKEDKKEDKISKKEKKKIKKLNDVITLAFAKNRSNDRKSWLSKYDKNNVLENVGNVTYSDFINKELIHFSNSDNIRSIPSLIDGLKPSLRKILFAAFKRGKNANEIKVSQFAGYISNETEYHHGENSLLSAIIGLAQNYPGSNNINLLMPNGAFGSRRQLGEDAASPRYIFTNVNKLMYTIFRNDDLPILNYLEEDGKMVEPEYYEPILPMILVNGSIGIGTGYSTKIPLFNPIEVVDGLKSYINKTKYKDIHPYYRDYKGKITKIDDQQYMMSGLYEIIDQDTVHISEIPLNISFENYKKFLNDITINANDKKEEKKDDEIKKRKIEKNLIDYTMKPSNNYVDITLKFKPTTLQPLIKNDEINKYLKLTSSIALTNMILYDEHHKIKQYESAKAIISEFYEHRYKIYVKRKEHLIQLLENELNIIKYKVKFIEFIFDKKIIIEKQKKDDIIGNLEKLKFPKLAKKVDLDESEKSYSYLIEMPLWSLTYEKIEELKKQLEEKQNILENYKMKTIEDIWNSELDEFIKEYQIWLQELQKIKDEEEDMNINKKGKKRTKKTKTEIDKGDSDKEKKPRKKKNVD